MYSSMTSPAHCCAERPKTKAGVRRRSVYSFEGIEFVGAQLSCLPRDLEAILAVDEGAGLGDAGRARAQGLEQHALGPDARLHRALHVPDVRVLRGHFGAVEARVQQ